MELFNGHLDQLHLSASSSFQGRMLPEAENCFHWQTIRLLWHSEPAGDKVHHSGNLFLGIHVYSYIIPNRQKRPTGRDRIKDKITALSNLHQNYPSPSLLQEFWPHSCHNFRGESWAMKGPKSCPLMATSQRSNSIKGTQITYFYSCNFW